MAQTQKTPKAFTRSLGWVMMLSAVVCFVMADHFSDTIPIVHQEDGTVSVLIRHFPPKGGEMTDLVVKSPFESYQIDIYQDPELMQWSHVDVAIYNAAGRYMFGFGDEFWYESGRDSEGYDWTEWINTYSARFTLPQGLYKLVISSEQSAVDKVSDIQLKLQRLNGSQLPFIWLGVVLLLVGWILNVMGKREKWRFAALRWRESWPTTDLTGIDNSPPTSSEQDYVRPMTEDQVLSIDFKPHIELVDLYGAYKSYLKDVDPRTVVILGDATVFSYAKYGFAVTHDTFYLCSDKAGKKALKFHNIQSIESSSHIEGSGDNEKTIYTLDIHFKSGRALHLDSESVKEAYLPALGEYLEWKRHKIANQQGARR